MPSQGQSAPASRIADEGALPGYLDAASGQPIHPAARQAWVRAAEQAWAEPAGLHGPSRQAGLLLDAARASLAASLTSCSSGPAIRPDQVWLAPSASQARDALLVGMPGPIVTSAIETVPILDEADRRPGSVVVGVMPDGRVDADACAASCADIQTRSPAVLCLQVANAEVGTIQPEIHRPTAMPWIADATQCIARIRLPQGWSAIWASARDWAGPASLGIAVVREPRHWHRPPGAVRGWLSGSADVPSAVAAAMALEALIPTWQAEAERAHRLIDQVREQVAARVPDVEVVADPHARLPHALTFSVLYVSGESLVSALDRHGLSVASGSACVADEHRPSHVLAAMGAYTGGNVRISLPFGCTQDTIDRFLRVLPVVVRELRDEVGR